MLALDVLAILFYVAAAIVSQTTFIMTTPKPSPFTPCAQHSRPLTNLIFVVPGNGRHPPRSQVLRQGVHNQQPDHQRRPLRGQIFPRHRPARAVPQGASRHGVPLLRLRRLRRYGSALRYGWKEEGSSRGRDRLKSKRSPFWGKTTGINPVQSSIFGIAFHHHCSAMRRRRQEGVSGKAYFLSMRMTLMSISPVTHAVPSCLSLPDSHIFDAEQFNRRWIRDSAAISDLSRPKRSIYRSSITHGALLQRLLHCLSCSFACHPSIQGAVQFLSWSLGPLT